MYREIVFESDIITKINNSDKINFEQKQEFIHLISYFTPAEIEELKILI